MSNIERLQDCLKRSFAECAVEIRDPRCDGNHLEVTIISPLFQGKSRIEQHRMVYAALEDLMTTGALHALSIETRVS